MKAIVYHEYGSADVLKLEEIETPTPKDNEVLIKVRAAALNPLDWRFMKGEPALIRVIGKLMKMGFGRPGVDVAGEVVAAGKNVTQFKSGDKVFGSCVGALAEYTCTAESKVVTKPEKVTFEQAASINVAGLTALQGLRDKAKIQRGEKVLINGAAGGVGTFAVQIAKHFGTEVTGVCSTRNVDTVKSIGAHQVIDYTKENFADLPKRYDAILDCVGNKSLAECRRVLNPKGRCIVVGGPKEISMIDILTGAIAASASSMFSDRKVTSFVAKGNQQDLTFIGDLIANGELSPVIDVRHGLSEAVEGMRFLEAGHARGKIVIAVSNRQEGETGQGGNGSGGTGDAGKA